MGIYFKQMGMNAGQCGLLIGTRPFVEFLSAPFWGSYADRYSKQKSNFNLKKNKNINCPTDVKKEKLYCYHHLEPG